MLIPFIPRISFTHSHTGTTYCTFLVLGAGILLFFYIPTTNSSYHSYQTLTDLTQLGLPVPFVTLHIPFLQSLFSDRILTNHSRNRKPRTETILSVPVRCSSRKIPGRRIGAAARVTSVPFRHLACTTEKASPVYTYSLPYTSQRSFPNLTVRPYLLTYIERPGASPVPNRSTYIPTTPPNLGSPGSNPTPTAGF